MKIIYEDSITVAKGYTFKIQVNDEGMVRFVYPDSIDPDDMEPMLSPEDIASMTATLSDDGKMALGIALALMTTDEMEDWGFMGLKAGAEARRIKENK